MSPFTKLLTAAPVTTELLPPSAFADSWARRPREPIRIGMRSVSANELTKAMKMAAESAWETIAEPSDADARLDVYNDHLITNVLAKACTLERDIASPYFAPAPEDLIRVALTAGGIRRLWDAYEAMCCAATPLGDALDATQMDMLGELLRSHEARATPRARRLAAALMKELAPNG